MTSTSSLRPVRTADEELWPALRRAGSAGISPAGSQGLRALLDRPGEAVVAVDFDGTLAPVVTDPATARPLPQALAALVTLARHGVRVVIVTGRPAGYVVAAAALRNGTGAPRITVLGHYGLQRWESATGRLHTPAPHPAIDRLRRELRPLVARHGAGARIEDKAHSIGVHTRGCPDPGAALRLLEPPVRALADDLGLRVEAGRLVLEVRPHGVDKATALTGFLAERPAHAVLYAGDDLADLPVLRLLARRRAQGLPSVTVYSVPAVPDEAVPELRDHCDLRVPGPGGVAALLAVLGRGLVDRRP
ncbi:trehalose-phosphatase [Streptomyces sp. NBC_00631]|uniref:trehalose-phosphatase n=1 Tax=Streptomyces sp. NBC_00631 TaxID=2975793 RepID=UPI0030E556A3